MPTSYSLYAALQASIVNQAYFMVGVGREVRIMRTGFNRYCLTDENQITIEGDEAKMPRYLGKQLIDQQRGWLPV